MATGNVVVIEGLAEFRRDLRRAELAAPHQLSVALKAAGVPIIATASARLPHRTGRLASSLGTSVRGTRADIVSSAPYAGGAEWGSKGKWAGWVERHGAPPRFVWPAIEEEGSVVVELVYQELRNVMTAFGWFHG